MRVGTMLSAKLRSRRVRSLLLASVMLAGMVGGALSMSGVAEAVCATPFNCGGDQTVTSSLTVKHAEDNPSGASDAVEPDDSETWSITTTYDSVIIPGEPQCSCSQVQTVNVTAVVTWTGSTYEVSCSGCDAVNGPIFDVDVCTQSTCTSGSTIHSPQYELIVDMDHTIQWTCPTDGLMYLAHPTQVDYRTTAVDDGDELESCNEVAEVSPTSQKWSATDTGTFECAFDCTADGPSVTILYD